MDHNDIRGFIVDYWDALIASCDTEDDASFGRKQKTKMLAAFDALVANQRSQQDKDNALILKAICRNGTVSFNFGTQIPQVTRLELPIDGHLILTDEIRNALRKAMGETWPST